MSEAGGAAKRARLDLALVELGLARSRGQARELLATGGVLVNGVPAGKASTPVTDSDVVTVVAERARWVSRGADKMLAALAAFGPEGLMVAGRRALDVGASTGGFTQVLVEHGAREVLALDVGHDQLAPTVAADPRVRDLSGRTVRDLAPTDLGGPVDLLVADLSFISLTLVMPDLARVCRPDADLVLLVKPQFEVGRARLGKNGIVRSGADRADAIRRVITAAQDAGLSVCGLADSPVTGTHGNREVLLWLQARPVVSGSWQALSERIDALDAVKGG